MSIVAAADFRRRRRACAAAKGLLLAMLACACGRAGADGVPVTAADVPTVFASALAPLAGPTRDCASGALAGQAAAHRLVRDDVTRSNRGRALRATMVAWEECGLLPADRLRRSELFVDPLPTATEKEARCLAKTRTGAANDPPLTSTDVRNRGRALSDCVLGARRRAGIVASDLGLAAAGPGEPLAAPCALGRLVEELGTWKAIMLYRGLFPREWSDDDATAYVKILDSCHEAPVLGSFDMRAYVRLGRGVFGQNASAPAVQSLPGTPVPTAPPVTAPVDPVF